MQPASPSAKSELTYLKASAAQQPALVQLVTDILQQEDSHKASIFGNEFWEWQYRHLPGGDARAYVVEEDGQLQGYYHVPVYRARIGGKTIRLAAVQDVAVSAAMRGRGVFRQLATFANDDFANGGIDYVYTFPNGNSIHTFLKYNGYSQLCTYSSWVLPLKTGHIIRSKKNLLGLELAAGAVADAALSLKGRKLPAGLKPELLPEVTDELAQLFDSYNAAFPVALVRDTAFLTWRYLQRPGSNYYLLGVRSGGKLAAACVWKYDEMLGNPALILMDQACLPGQEYLLHRLICTSARTAARTWLGRPVHLAFAAGAGRFYGTLGKAGFWRVPAKLDPRPLNLLIRNITLADDSLPKQAGNWNLNLGDWDVF